MNTLLLAAVSLVALNAIPARADYPITYDIVGANYQVVDPTGTALKFYRLRGPP